MKQTIFSNWNFMRFLRLGLGLAITIQAAMAGDFTMGVIGILFTAMPVFNLGCCGTNGCSTPVKKNVSTTSKETSYEEVL